MTPYWLIGIIVLLIVAWRGRNRHDPHDSATPVGPDRLAVDAGSKVRDRRRGADSLAVGAYSTPTHGELGQRGTATRRRNRIRSK
jgi:hypothetical protein